MCSTPWNTDKELGAAEKVGLRDPVGHGAHAIHSVDGREVVHCESEGEVDLLVLGGRAKRLPRDPQSTQVGNAIDSAVWSLLDRNIS